MIIFPSFNGVYKYSISLTQQVTILTMIITSDHILIAHSAIANFVCIYLLISILTVTQHGFVGLFHCGCLLPRGVVVSGSRACPHNGD